MMDPQEKQEQRRSEVAEAIWTRSRQDEGTISVMGADIIAAHLDDRGMITDPCVCAAYVDYPDGPAEECPRHGRPYEYWVEGCTALSQKLAQADKPDPCKMTHTEPFDFAQCETHDTTFALGGKCEWDGVESIYEHLEDKIDEQRGLKVLAEMKLVLAEMKLGQIRNVLDGPHTSFDSPELLFEQIQEILEDRQ